MTKTIVVAGYTKQKNIHAIRSYFPNEKVVLICAYTRQPSTETKQAYLALFDITYDLTRDEDAQQLRARATEIDCVTCTQERDMVAYIYASQLCQKITAQQAEKYTYVINKHTFKEEISKVYPELVPMHHVITPELLEQLESLSYPQIIKPSGLAGSIMIRAVHSPAEFRAHHDMFAEQIQAIGREHYTKDVEVITEDFVIGPQYSVNAFINAHGEVTLCPLVRVVTPQELGINDTYSVYQYTTDELTDEAVAALQDAVQKITTHFEIKNTSAHFDAVLSNGQWKFFEVGLRFGGNRQKLYELSYHMDTLRNDIYNRLGHTIHFPQQKKYVCIMQKCSEEEGVLAQISYTRTITDNKIPLILEDKITKIGTLVKPLSLGGGTITRHFITGNTQEEVLEHSKTLFESITFTLT